ncbi:type VI secretion system protein TssA [Vibrio sp. RE86]|uniref:type VI secretion system protein TssA n=1 Tax=Vibrio sp. RE86 TaxID=2607605 RepID=UPI00149354B1|nr:type VI secretion system protein TssA [Vibrio sp. RE86]NOH79410.1 type VI secretion system protein TssA [Vibrio sp. RE86]
MDITTYRSSIVTPISRTSPVGERLIDEPLFDFIEDQMMKVGSLSHSLVQWSEVEFSAVTLLGEKSKDIKLLVYLLQCLHNDLTPSRLITSFGVMSDFMSHYWEESFPAPGKRGNLPRRKYFSQMCQRFSMVVDKFDFSLLDSQSRDELVQAVSVWESTIEAQSLQSDIVESLVVSIRHKIKQAEDRAQLAQPAPSSRVTAQTSTPQNSKLSIDNSSDKAVKDTLLKVADFLAEQEFGIALATRLRRHAVWGAITTLPDHDEQGHTMLRGMQADRVKEYQDQMKSPDLALWRRVEQSLTLAPFWFEGQLLSHDIAKVLGHDPLCDAIKQETQQFIDRFPSLCELKFKGGSPFVTDSVRHWLQAEESTSSVMAGGWQEQRESTFTLAREGGIAVAMSKLNDGLQAATEPRERFYWRLLSAELMQEHQLEEIAKEQYHTLKQEVLQASVSQWEPTLIEQLERHTSSD